MMILLDITVISKEFIDTLNTIKPLFLTFIFVIAVGYAVYQAHIGGHDKRAIMNTIIGVFIAAILIYSSDKIIIWLGRIAG
jgi:uncharacterized YccA/Bax inhibitor family protein